LLEEAYQKKINKIPMINQIKSSKKDFIFYFVTRGVWKRYIEGKRKEKIAFYRFFS
jgi:hypothetical protein